MSGHSSVSELLAVLKIFGPQLLSLQIGECGSDSRGFVLPAECLELCPCLERMDTTWNLNAPPPPDHPLHTISIRIQAFDTKEWTGSLLGHFK
jgi:hypothetical protein